MENNIDKAPEEKKFKEFGLSNLALKNKTSVFLLAICLGLAGIISYKAMPKELFPEVNMPWIMVMTPYPGNPPIDIENLVTREIEKEVESVKGIKKITSNSTQDASMIFVEFNFGIDVKDAKRDVKDAVEKAMDELPNDLPRDPMVMDIDFSEFPILNIHLSGDYSIDELKRFAEELEQRIEGVYEISKVEIQGINDKEIKIDVDRDKLESFNMSFNDIERAVTSENISMSGGEIKKSGSRWAVRIVGEFESVDAIKNIIVKAEDGNVIYMRDVARVTEDYEEPSSYARLNGQPVVSLQVVKKGGENLLNATEQIEEILVNARKDGSLPKDLNISVTNDQSDQVKMQISNLENSMVMSIMFVVLVLFFFLGTRNAMFVGLAIPLSMFLSYMILAAIGYRINMIVLFALILALGMLVDNAIVVVENIYRFITEGYSKKDAARLAVGEIAVPIIASTATTLAAFFPLVFWDSIMGQFMKYLPITLIVVLSSSLFVALVIIPVVAEILVKKDAQNEPPNRKRALIIATVLFVLSILSFMGGSNTFGNLFGLGAAVTLLNLYILNRLSRWFQNNLLVKLENFYLRLIKWTLRGSRPWMLFIGTIVLMIVTWVFYGIRSPKVEFFPSGDPKFVNLMAELPIGTDIQETNSFMLSFEKDVLRVLGEDTSIVKSIVTNVGEGAKLENDMNGQMEKSPNKGLITVNFVDFELRGEKSSSDILRRLSDSLIGQYPGVQLVVEKNKSGPPTGKPINIEVSGDDFDLLILYTDSIINKINSENIKGIEGLKIDLDLGKPEIEVRIDRERARRFGLSTAQIAMTLRTALFGNEISDFKVGEEKYPMQLRLEERYRNDIVSLMNQKVIFRNNKGRILKIPISAVADFNYSTTYGSVKRKDLKRVITIYSNVLEGYNANEINAEIGMLLENFQMHGGYEWKFTGEQQDQEEAAIFLMLAFSIAIALIILILVAQFNSTVKPFMIMISVLLSTIGVFGGLATFNMSFIVVMTGIGIVSLAGVVVNNAIVLIDYIDQLKVRRKKDLGLEENESLKLEDERTCIQDAGKTRLRPVLLTAITTILGLIPMAVGINIDFFSMLSDFDPKLSFGGDNAAMWSPLSWTVIFGLTFATFLTLVIVPVMYYLATRTKKWFVRITS